MSALPHAAPGQPAPADLAAPTEDDEVSFEEFLAIEDEERSWELVDGHLKERSGGVYESLVAARIIRGLCNDVEAAGIGGYVLTEEAVFRCFENQKTGRKPDVSYVAAGRLGSEDLRSAYLKVSPDLAVEVISPSDRLRQVRAKEQQYLNAGVRLLWRVDPDHREVTVYAAGEKPRLVVADECLDGGDVLPGLSLSVGDLFVD